MPELGLPRLHLRRTGSTNDRASALAKAGAPHGTLVTADEQTAGRGRQGREWTAPAGSALLLSLVVREPDALLPLRAGLAVADVAGPDARVKWPNDVLLAGRKVAGVLVEARLQEKWAVLGMGINVSVDPQDLPEALRATAGGLGRPRQERDAVLGELLVTLTRRLAEPAVHTVDALRSRDALFGRPVVWDDGSGVGAGVDGRGALLVRTSSGAVVALHSGEVHLTAAG